MHINISIIKFKYLLFVLILLQSTIQFSQKLTIKIVDDQKNSIIGAIVLLENQVDSIKFMGNTGINGDYSWQNLPDGNYNYKINYLGFDEKVGEISIPAPNRWIEIMLSQNSTVLSEVNIVAKKSLFRQDGEKTILDPEALSLSVSNTYELLSMTPGVFMDDDGNIFLGNTLPAAIFINGREQRLSTSDIANILRSLPPGNIQRIEILKSPSVKYDAASSGGILNVVLKKGVKIGRFGSANAAFNQGQKGNRSIGFNMFDTNAKSGYYINTNIGLDGSLESIETKRILGEAPLLTQIGKTTRDNLLGYIGWGYNKQLNDQWTWNYDGRYNINRINGYSSFLNNQIYDNQTIIFSNSNFIDISNNSTNHSHDLSFDYISIDKKKELNLKLGASNIKNSAEQVISTALRYPIQSTPDTTYRENSGSRDFALLQADYLQKFDNEWKLETGVKILGQKFQDNTLFYRYLNSKQQIDSVRQNSYSYNEIISALYVQISKTFRNNITITSGVRLEHSLMQGTQFTPRKDEFNINRLDPFPYLFITRRLFKMVGYDLAGTFQGRRTLSRPSYQNLSPGIVILDVFNYQRGNPLLKPQFTNNYEFNIGFDNIQIFSIGKNITDGIISNVLYEDETFPNIAFNTYDNIGRSNETYFKIMGGVPPTFKYFVVAGIQYNHLAYQGLYNGAPITFNRGSWQYFTFHKWSITKTTNLMMYGFWIKNGQRNFLELGDFGQLNFTLSQQMLNKKLQVSIYYRDVLRSMEVPFNLEQGNVSFSGTTYRDNQRYGINIRYNFGITTKKEQKSTFGIQEEN